jgi:altronate dehydratase
MSSAPQVSEAGNRSRSGHLRGGLAVASGQKTKSESLDYGEEEFVPWHIGTVM